MRMTDSPSAYPTYSTPPASPESAAFSDSDASDLSDASQARTEQHQQHPTLGAAGGPLAALARARGKRPMSLSSSDSEDDIVLPTARQLRSISSSDSEGDIVVPLPIAKRPRFADGASSSRAAPIVRSTENGVEGQINDPTNQPIIRAAHSNPSADDSIDRLPDDLIFDHILPHLPPRSLGGVASVSRKYRQWARQLTAGAFHQLPDRLIVETILPKLRSPKDLGRFALASRQCTQWANQRISNDPRYASPRFNNLFELGQFIHARHDRSAIHELVQLHQMVLAGTAPAVHIPTLVRLFQRPLATRSVHDLIEAGLLTPAQIAGVRLDLSQSAYLVSNRVLHSLARRMITPNLHALSHIPSAYFGIEGVLRPGGILQAFQGQRYDVVKQMVASDLFIKISNTGSSPLHDAVFSGDHPVVQALLDCGATDVIHWRNHLGETALHMAIRMEREDIAQTLIAYGAVPNIGNRQGSTPLHYAVIQGDLMIGTVRALLQTPSARLAINLGNRQGQTALDLASVSPRSLEVARLLRAAGAQTAAELNAEARNENKQ